ncbi:MAG: adenylate/guanylate cyclase domain-containing protein [Chloroflexota bacterium]
MWILTVRSPGGEPRQYTLHPGNNTIGRMSGNDIVILDPSASRYHAQVVFEPEHERIQVQDLGSTNGTFLNRDRLAVVRPLTVNDVIRIGQHLIELSYQDESLPPLAGQRPMNTQMLTRDLILESLDQHAVLLSEVASRLNTILDLPTALHTVASMMKVSMGADRCEVILIDQVERLAELGFARSIAQQAIQQRSAVILQDASHDPNFGHSAALLNIHAAMCVPVMSSDEMLGLIYVFKNRPRTRAFDKRDLQLAVAIGHQAALTIQRMKLLERVRKQEVIANLLNRFLSPQEAQFIMQEYQETGQLPAPQDHSLTVVAADISESTQLAQRLGSRRFAALLTNYYREMTQAIFDQGGMLNKYMGDGLMAIFGLPHQPPDPEVRAVRTGLAMLDCLERINQKHSEQLCIGVGINSGPCMAGYLGSLDYVEFSIIGYPVNIAWGLEAMARPNRILIGHPTYQAVADKFLIQPLGVLSLKPQIEPIQAYEVIRSNQ